MRSINWSRVHKCDVQWSYNTKKMKRLPKDSKPLALDRCNGYNPNAIRKMELLKGGNRADSVLRKFD